MRFTASTRPSRTRFCPTSSTGPSGSSAQLQRILPSRSSRRCSPDAVSTLCSPLPSRCRFYPLQALSEEDLLTLLRRALTDTDRGLGNMHVTAEEDALITLASYSSGDARNALNALE